MPEGMTPQQFIAKWSRVELPERAASQEHFIDLYRMLGQPTPAEHDATGAEYTFEKGVTVTGSASRGSRGDAGFAHEQLDRAVLAAYATTDPGGGWFEDWAAVWIESGAGQPLPNDHTLAGRRREIDERVLGNLLRLNEGRA